jgi:tetratricopeptide (TPR) repeat protein
MMTALEIHLDAHRTEQPLRSRPTLRVAPSRRAKRARPTVGSAVAAVLVACGCAARPLPPNWTVVEAAEAATEREDWAAALDYWNRALIESRGSDPRPYLEKARAMWALDDEEGAQILLDRGLERYPSDRGLRLLRGELLTKRGFHRAAERDFLFAVEVDPECSESWLQLARVQLELDLPGSAEVGLERHLELGGTDTDAQFLLGRACAENGKLEKAMASFRTAFASGRVGVEELVLAASVVTLERFELVHTPYLGEALGWVDRALARQPQHAEASYVRGMILELERDDVAAAEAYSRAVELDNFHLLAMTRLARTYARLGEIRRADAMIDRALELNIAASRRRMLERVRESWHPPGTPPKD